MKGKQNGKLFIRNMVCQRCILTVESILEKLEVSATKISLGEVELASPLSETKLKQVETALIKLGFELIETKLNKIVEDIKQLILQNVSDLSGEKNIKLSSLITCKIHYEYSYISDIFSSVEGITIEQYFIRQRIEKVKELLVYEELSLTEIAYQTGFSSVHHLSAQFKKTTGLTPSHFKKLGAQKRRSIDKL